MVKFLGILLLLGGTFWAGYYVGQKPPDEVKNSLRTMSENVVPVLAEDGSVLAVLDIDSDIEAAFDANDKKNLEALCTTLATYFR